MMHQAISKISILMTGMITLKPLKLNTYSGLSITQAAFIKLSVSSSHALAMLRVQISVWKPGCRVKQTIYVEYEHQNALRM